MNSPEALLRLLRDRQQDAAERLEDSGDFGAAVCEVLDELVRRAQVIADEYPASSQITLTDLQEMPAVVGAMQTLMETVATLSDVMRECADAMELRRDPVLRFIERLKSEGYEVEDDFTVTDTRDYIVVDSTNPAIQVQIEADKITRTERTTAYQERITRMATAFEETQNEYVRRVRSLIGTALDG